MIKLIFAKIKSISWKQWLLVAFFFILCIIIFGKCNTDQPVEYKPVIIQSTSGIIKMRNAYDDTVKALRSQIAISKKEKEASEKLMKRANTELSTLIVKYNEAKAAQNVTVQLDNCDSIVSQNTDLLAINGVYQNDMNQLVDYYDSALKASDSSSLYQTRLATTLNANLQSNIADYNELAKVYNKQVKKTKRNRGLNRVLAGALLVTSGILIVK